MALKIPGGIIQLGFPHTFLVESGDSRSTGLRITTSPFLSFSSLREDSFLLQSTTIEARPGLDCNFFRSSFSYPSWHSLRKVRSENSAFRFSFLALTADLGTLHLVLSLILLHRPLNSCIIVFLASAPVLPGIGGFFLSVQTAKTLVVLQTILAATAVSPS
jgi:hypothetical protein